MKQDCGEQKSGYCGTATLNNFFDKRSLADEIVILRNPGSLAQVSMDSKWKFQLTHLLLLVVQMQPILRKRLSTERVNNNNKNMKPAQT